jgi:hypothetical protein
MLLLRPKRADAGCAGAALLCCRFKEKYARPGLPHEDPRVDPSHKDYEPFQLPMPTLKSGAAAALCAIACAAGYK